MTVNLDLRCSSWARAAKVDPVGTAGSYRGYLLVEWPLPWPRDVAEIAALAAVARAAREADVRLQAVVPQGGGELTVALHTWHGALGRFVGYEAPAGADPAATALDLLAGHEVPGRRMVEVKDVLICSHGGRDRCCGSLGTSLEVELRSTGELESAGVRLRRTSHTGGHRFAPTGIVLPEGSAWGYLDVRSLIGIVTRTLPVSDVLGLYRGCSGLGSPAVQALERSVLSVVGWTLFDRPRTGFDHGDGRVSLEVSDPGDGYRRWEGRVVTGRILPVPQCGSALSGSEKTEPELAVESLNEMGGPAARAG